MSRVRVHNTPGRVLSRGDLLTTREATLVREALTGAVRQNENGQQAV